ncbi:MAG: hypothetical protein JO340_16345 [Acidobacteriaceae bacterium]|nr:hypothetical protein [Acidobacteriaceae bacterium]
MRAIQGEEERPRENRRQARPGDLGTAAERKTLDPAEAERNIEHLMAGHRMRAGTFLRDTEPEAGALIAIVLEPGKPFPLKSKSRVGSNSAEGMDLQMFFRRV